MLILLLVGRCFLGFEFDKKFLADQVAIFGCFAGVFEGGSEKIVRFLMVICWWICGDCVVDRGAKMVLI